VGAAGQLLLTPRLRPRAGPALRPGPLPVTAALLSMICHGALVALVVVVATTWSSRPTKAYVVNLVPAVPAVGSPQGRPAPSLPPRAEEPPPRVTRRSPSELPDRETPRTPAPPPPAPDLPARPPSLPDLPTRTTPPPPLPDRAMPPRPTTTPRTGEKELPAVASAPAPPAPPTTAPTAPSRPEPPPPALGRASGSAQGAGALTLNVTDFPFAWYLAAVQRKVNERWDDKAQPGRQPVVTFVIARDGQVSRVVVKDSSGNSYYDRAAMRAIADAAPFPALPAEYAASELTVHMGFNFARDRG
jgi:periplasmic protein TonB